MKLNVKTYAEAKARYESIVFLLFPLGGFSIGLLAFFLNNALVALLVLWLVVIRIVLTSVRCPKCGANMGYKTVFPPQSCRKCGAS